VAEVKEAGAEAAMVTTRVAVVEDEAVVEGRTSG